MKIANHRVTEDTEKTQEKEKERAIARSSPSLVSSLCPL